MAFPQSFLDELIARSDIVDVVGSYVQLTRKGSNLFGLCPFHSEKTGSFSVSPGQTDLLLLRLQAGRRRYQLHHGGGESLLPGCRALFGQTGGDGGAGGGRRPGGRPQAPASSGPEPGRRPFYYQMLQQPEGRAVQEYLTGAENHPATAVNFGLGAISGCLGRAADPGHDEEGLYEVGAAGCRAGGAEPERRSLRQVPQPADLSGD